MKKLLFIFSIVIITLCGFSQNLVPNYSFEDTVLCPFSFDQLGLAKGWNVNINTADYYHECGSNGFITPYPLGDYQLPATGVAYSGIITIEGITIEDIGEIIGRKLAVPLTIGQKYYVSFKVNLANYVNCGVDKLGALFTNVNYKGDTVFFGNDTLFDPYLMVAPMPIVQNFAHIYSNQIITDTVNWTTVSGSFVADSAYKYILIGRFFDENNINITCTDTNTKWSYYYIDDVCVSLDSAVCDIIETVNQPISAGAVKIYPNPTKGKFKVESSKFGVEKVEVYDLFGRMVFQTTDGSNPSIDLSKQPAGIYFISIHINETIKQQKIILL